MEDAVCFLFFVLQTIRHLTAVFVATQSDIYSREVSFMVIKYCISIQHRIFSPTSCFCVMSTFTLMIGSLKITTTFVTCVCLIGSVIQVVLDHLGTSAPLHRSRTSVSAASNQETTACGVKLSWRAVQHRALRERSGSAHTSQDVWYLPKLSSRLFPPGLTHKHFTTSLPSNVWKRGTETTSVFRIHSLFYFCCWFVVFVPQCTHALYI